MDELLIVKYVNHLGSGTIIDSISIFISGMVFISLLWIILTLCSYKFDNKNGKLVLLGVIFATSLHFLISELIIKHLLSYVFDPRIRPYLIDPQNIIPLGQRFMDSSFPSSHVASTVAILMIFGYYYRKTLIPAIIFVLMMGWSRIHNGMHYPTDILGGIILGLSYGVIAIYLSKKAIKLLERRKEHKIKLNKKKMRT